MSIDNIFKLIEVITNLLNVLIWPGVVVFLSLRFSRELRQFFLSLDELKIKGVGVEASLIRKQAEITAALAAATVSQRDGDTTREGATREVERSAGLVAEVVTPRVMRQARRSNILWVDDRPNNNIYERQALEALGINFVLATSTEEALRHLSRQHFDVIISDMGRPPDLRAGYTLLDKIRADGNRTPFIIYAGSKTPEHVTESREHGAIGCTNNPNELFEIVLLTLENYD